METTISQTSRVTPRKSLPFITIIGVVIIVGIILTVVFLLVSGKLNLRNPFKKGSPDVSSHILYLTSPVNDFSGTIEKVEDDSIWVKKTVTRELQVPISSGQSGDETPESVTVPTTRTINYKVIITDKTQVTRVLPEIPYLFSKSLPQQTETLDISSFSAGQFVEINTATDLRTVVKDEFEATSVRISMISNNINGTIVSISDNNIHLRAIPPVSPDEQAHEDSQLEEKDFTIRVTSGTEISNYASDDPSKSIRYQLSDLKQNMQITVYTDVDIAQNQEFTAKRIVPTI